MLIVSLHGLDNMRHFANKHDLIKLRYLFKMENEIDEEKFIRLNDTIHSFDFFLSHGRTTVTEIKSKVDNNNAY